MLAVDENPTEENIITETNIASGGSKATKKKMLQPFQGAKKKRSNKRDSSSSDSKRLADFHIDLDNVRT